MNKPAYLTNLTIIYKLKKIKISLENLNYVFELSKLNGYTTKSILKNI